MTATQITGMMVKATVEMPIEELVLEGKRIFERRVKGHKATHALVNTMYEGCSVEGMVIERVKFVRPGQALVGERWSVN